MKQLYEAYTEWFDNEKFYGRIPEDETPEDYDDFVDNFQDRNRDNFDEGLVVRELIGGIANGREV